MENCNNHDHYNGQCLISYWEGVSVRGRDPKELQERIEKNHLKQLKVWLEEANKNNVAPF